MDCPFLQYKDGACFDYEYYCKVMGKMVGDQDHKSQVENTCKNSQFYDCPVYKKERY